SMRRRYQTSRSCREDGLLRSQRPCASSVPAAVPGHAASSHSAPWPISAGDAQAPASETAMRQPRSSISETQATETVASIQLFLHILVRPRQAALEEALARRSSSMAIRESQA